MGPNYIIKQRSYLPASFFSLMLWIVASLPGKELEGIQKYPENTWLRAILSDPFMHFLVFGMLSLLLCRGFYREFGWPIPLVKVAFLACGYGIIIEVYQGILPLRSFGFDDLLWRRQRGQGYTFHKMGSALDIESYHKRKGKK